MLFFIFLSVFCAFSQAYYINSTFEGPSFDGTSQYPFQNLSQFFSVAENQSYPCELIFLNDVECNNAYLFNFGISLWGNGFSLIFSEDCQMLSSSSSFNLYQLQITFANLSSNNSYFIFTNNSQILFQEVYFMNFKNLHSDTSPVFNVVDSTFLINNSFFQNLVLSGSLFRIQENSSSPFRVLVENSNFCNISLLVPNIADLFLITGVLDSVEILNSVFKNNINFTNLINIINIQGSLTINTTEFGNNFVVSEILNIQNYNVAMIMNTRIDSNNYYDGVFYVGSGGSISLLNGMQKIFINLTISNCFTDNGVFGIEIIDNNNRNVSDSSNLYVNVYSCSFVNNSLNYINGDNGGGALYLDSPDLLIMKETLMQNNTIQCQVLISPIRISSPCLFSVSAINLLVISDSLFIENHSRYSSNCLTFSGQSLNLSNSSFENNTSINSEDIISMFISGELGVIDIAQINPELGAAVYFQGSNLFVFRTYFCNNTSIKGGGIYVTSYSVNVQQIIMITECSFKGNRANVGGAINLSVNLLNIYSLIESSIFYSNIGKSGGGITVEYQFPDCYTSVVRSYFFNNSAMFGGSLNNEADNSLLSVSECFFELNVGYSFLLHVGGGADIMMKGEVNSSLNSINNTFFNCLGSFSETTDAKSSIIQYSSNFTDINSIFIGNRKSTRTSCYAGESFANATFIGTRFIYNYASYFAGALSTSFYSFIYLESNLFLDCTSFMGGVLTISERSALIIRNGNFTNNYADTGGILFCYENYDTSVVLMNSTFTNNTCIENLFNMIVAFLEVDFSTFSNNLNPIFSLYDDSILWINNFTTYNHTCNSLIMGCFLNSLASSEIFVQNATLFNISNNNEEGNFYLEESSGIISMLKMDTINNLKNRGSCFSLLNSQLEITQSVFSNYDYNCIYGTSSNLTLQQNVLNNQDFLIDVDTTNTKFGSIFCDSCLLVQISECVFLSNLMSDIGGAIGLQDCSSTYVDYALNLSNCSFVQNNVNQMGGAVYLQNSDGWIADCLFSANKAQYGAGIYYQSLYTQPAVLILQGNSFIANQAEFEGGGIKWDEIEPLELASNEFNNNTAIYGKDIAAFPLRIEMQNDLRNYSCSNNSSSKCYFWIADVASGSPLNFSLDFVLKDYYNQTYSLNGQMELNFLGSNPVNSTVTTNAGFQNIQGDKTLFFSDGTASFSNLIIFAQPNSEVFFKITSASIVRYYGELLTNQDEIDDYNLNGNYAYVFVIRFRKCEIGEIFLSQINSCDPCGKGKYSLIDPNDPIYTNVTSSCKNCPTTAECSGGSSLSLLPGYWKPSLLSDYITSCSPYQDYCLGGESSLCSGGHVGPICGDCGAGFSKIGNACAGCMDSSTYILRVLGLLALVAYMLFFTGYLIFSIRETEKSLKSMQSMRATISSISVNDMNKLDGGKSISVYIKILINYSQMVGIIQNFDLKWPYYIDNFFPVISTFGFISTDVLTMDCFISGFFLDVPRVYIKSLVSLMFYACFMIGAVFILLIRRFFFHKRKQFSRFIMFFLVFSSMTQPTLIQENSDIFTCQNIDGQSYLVKEMSLQCYTETHNKWMLYLGLPSLLFWVLLYPMICLLYLIVNRAYIETPEMKMKMGYYLNGYKNEFFFWEFIIMYRKMIFIAFLLFPNIQIEQKTVYLLFFTGLSYILTNKFQPFALNRLNFLEEVSNLSALLIMFSGALYVYEVQDMVKAICFVFIVLINLQFFTSWFLTVSNIYIMVYGKKIFKYCPAFMNFIAVWQKTSHSVKFTLNIPKLLIEFSKKFMENSRSFSLKAV